MRLQELVLTKLRWHVLEVGHAETLWEVMAGLKDLKSLAIQMCDYNDRVGRIDPYFCSVSKLTGLRQGAACCSPRVTSELSLDPKPDD